MADREFRGWISSITTMLFSVNDNRDQVSSISKAPEKLRKPRGEAYTPKVVSIGPLHRGTKRELLHMEEIKWRCMWSLLDRSVKPNDPAMPSRFVYMCTLQECSQHILALDEAVRATYADDIRLNSYDLAKIMLLDGCFLLELLISNDVELDSAMTSTSPGPGVEVGKMEHLRSDLKLLENQIPIFILVVLFENLFTNSQFKDARKVVINRALFFLGCSPDPSLVDIPNCAHFLELMHRFITREEEDGIGEENNRHRSIIVGGNVNLNSRSTIPKLECCATSLKAAGVTIEPLHAAGGSML